MSKSPEDVSLQAHPDGERADARARAMDPRRNVVLEASAGTGKTSVLVNRYLNLLRAGVDPANILAITFTRKAATEMRARIVHELRTTATDSEEDRQRWHALRDRLGEVTISTIDAFCLSLLREFPLEAGLEPGFDMADEIETPRLVEHALDHMLRVCARLAHQEHDVALVLAQIGAERLRAGLATLLNRRLVAPAALQRFLAKGPVDLTAEHVCENAARRLQELLEGRPGGLHEFLRDGPVGHPRFEMLARDLRRLPALHGADGAAICSLLERVEEHFFTRAGTPRKRSSYNRQSYHSTEASKRHQQVVSALTLPVADVVTAFHRDLNVVLARGVRHMYGIAEREYRRALDAHAALDFPDLLLRALSLLRQMDEFAQSRYRLESRYHHVLVDEFQDTSRAQWELVSLLIQSWGEGLGLVHDAPLPPSVFIVGDRKQSIYGFRDAEVAVLQEAGDAIEGLRPDGGVRTSIARSFRAVPRLLHFVNDICGAVQKVDGRRDAFRYDAQDHFPVEADGTSDDARHPAASSKSESCVLGIAVADDERGCAEAVASEIERLIDEQAIRDPLTGIARPAHYDDIAILFRSRASHRAFERALHARAVPAYVYKGLGFFDADEIKDLRALMRYLADPTSNLRAAAFLRSRFVRLSDSAILALAPKIAGALVGAKPPTAFDDLAEEDRRVLARVRISASRWLALVDRLPPAELIDHVLSESAYPYEIRGRRMDQARENVKKMRGLLRRIQNRGYATLARIADHVDDLSTGDESNAAVDAVNAVNLMTVHAAKGLEFPVVFLVDITRGTGRSSQAIRVVSDRGDGTPSVSVGAFVSEADEDERQRDAEESKRLLYVAITRARDRLYLGSVRSDGELKVGRGSLAEILPRSFVEVLAGDRSAEVVEWKSDTGRVHQFQICRASAELAHDASAIAVSPKQGAGESVQPRDDFTRIEPRDRVTRVGVTSHLATGAGRYSDAEAPSSADELPRLLGTLVHRLLQSVKLGKNVERDVLVRRAKRLLRPDERACVDDDEVLAARAVGIYEAIVGQQDVARLLSSNCVYEVPFSLCLAPESSDRPGPPVPMPRIVRGVIDCLVHHDDRRVTVVEFKTGKQKDEDRVQLELYETAAAALFPDARVDGRLVYADSVP